MPLTPAARVLMKFEDIYDDLERADANQLDDVKQAFLERFRSVESGSDEHEIKRWKAIILMLSAYIDVRRS
jgi:hypothetical protein